MQRHVRFKEACKPDFMKWKLIFDNNGELYQVTAYNSCQKIYTCCNIETDETEYFTPTDLATMYFI